MLRQVRRLALVMVAVQLAVPAQAHLMVAQKGTLNFSGDGIYVVLSVPVSAFKGVDDDGDQLLSIAELRAHAASIDRQVHAGAQVLWDGHPVPLQGLMLNLSPSDDRSAAPANQIVVMGRYALGGNGDAIQARQLSFKLDLFGHAPAEQVYDITITRKPEAQAARYSPAQTIHRMLPTAAQVFGDQLRNGIMHVLGGADHLLFLLVVLASLAGAKAGWRWVVGTLTCFTAGHALSLAASAWGLVAISPALVEPAIAVTIIGMAVFDVWQRYRTRWAAPAVQLGLVFACALVHGLGFASSLGNLGLSGAPLVQSLAGFNLGIELAQVSVALLAAAGLAMLAHWFGHVCAERTSLTASLMGIGLGCGWLVVRVGGAL